MRNTILFPNCRSYLCKSAHATKYKNANTKHKNTKVKNKNEDTNMRNTKYKMQTQNIKIQNNDKDTQMRKKYCRDGSPSKNLPGNICVQNGGWMVERGGRFQIILSTPSMDPNHI